MSFEERNTLAFIVVSLIVGAIFALRIQAAFSAGMFVGDGGLMVWARMALWIIPVGIVLCIGGVILTHIAYAVLTQDRDGRMQTDERDQMIALRGLQVTLVVLSGGVIGTLGLIASGWSALIALNALLFGCWLSDLIGNLVKLYFYRRGF